MVSSKFAAAFEETERISAEIANYNQECAMLRDQIDGSAPLSPLTSLLPPCPANLSHAVLLFMPG